MKKRIYLLSALAVVLATMLVAIWLPPTDTATSPVSETRYGLNEGLELVEQTLASSAKRYVVEDEKRNVLFVVPLRNCVIDTRYRAGKLHFREQGSCREGYVDRQGMVTFPGDSNAGVPEDVKVGASMRFDEQANKAVEKQTVGSAADAGGSATMGKSAGGGKGQTVPKVSLQTMTQTNPFYKEASKILHGKLTEQDAKSRHMILNYCEHLRTAYTTKDIDFLRQVFSDKALIIVGNVVQATATDGKCQADSRVSYAIHSKQGYIERLSKVFATNRSVDVKFSDFHIMRHPTMDGIYGVTLRQQYRSDRYADDGYLFLLWDFRDKSMPLIHVRTWQPASTVADGADMISIQDFNLQ